MSRKSSARPGFTAAESTPVLYWYQDANKRYPLAFFPMGDEGESRQVQYDETEHALVPKTVIVLNRAKTERLLSNRNLTRLGMIEDANPKSWLAMPCARGELLSYAMQRVASRGGRFRITEPIAAAPKERSQPHRRTASAVPEVPPEEPVPEDQEESVISVKTLPLRMLIKEMKDGSLTPNHPCLPRLLSAILDEVSADRPDLRSLERCKDIMARSNDVSSVEWSRLRANCTMWPARLRHAQTAVQVGGRDKVKASIVRECSELLKAIETNCHLSETHLDSEGQSSVTKSRQRAIGGEPLGFNSLMVPSIADVTRS